MTVTRTVIDRYYQGIVDCTTIEDGQFNNAPGYLSGYTGTDGRFHPMLADNRAASTSKHKNWNFVREQMARVIDQHGGSMVIHAETARIVLVEDILERTETLVIPEEEV